jgi:hypothetical protein
MSRSAADGGLVLAACGVRPTTAAIWGPVFFDTLKLTAFSKGPAELIDFLPEILHESAMLERMVENLNYTMAARLCAVCRRGSPRRRSPSPTSASRWRCPTWCTAGGWATCIRVTGGCTAAGRPSA